MKEFYCATTPIAIAIIIMCVMIENKFFGDFEDDNTRERIKINIEIYNSMQRIMLLTLTLLLLFTPVVNLIISVIYGSLIIMQIIKNK